MAGDALMRAEITPLFGVEDQLGKTPRMIIMVGLPRTGKSTFVNTFIEDAIKAPNGGAFVIISSDDVRRAMGIRYDSDLEAQVAATTELVADTVMMRHQNVVIDNTNLTAKERQHWIDKATRFGYQWIVVEIEPLPVHQHKSVCAYHDYPWEVIEAMKRRYEPVGPLPANRYQFIPKEK